MRICVIHKRANTISETFIHAHVRMLPATVEITGDSNPNVKGDRHCRMDLLARAWRKATRRSWDSEITARYLSLFRRVRPEVVLAEYGPVGVLVREACRSARIPLVVHFHGYDASLRSVIEEHRSNYARLFEDAAGIVAVSRSMVERLVSLGAPAEKVLCNPYGVDVTRFQGANPGAALPTFLAVGRFVDKKAPHLTLLAFGRVLEEVPGARLRMIGDGELLGVCRDIARSLGMEHAVEFLGPRPPGEVAQEMMLARAFVQHSVVAESGDSEGTPVAVIEAGASGLPVVATRHAGIPDVVVDGETGLLVAERDVGAMAERMIRLARDPELSQRLGNAARARVACYFTLDRSVTTLREYIQRCCSRN